MSSETGENYYELAKGLSSYESKYNNAMNKPEENYNSRCTQIISNTLDEITDFMEPCLEILKNLSYIKRNNYETDNNIQCKYLNFRLNNQLKEIRSRQYTAPDFYEKFKTHSDDMKYWNICKGEIQEINKEILKNIEVLYNLYRNFNSFTSSYLSSTDNRCNYGDKCANLYNTHVKSCTSQEQNKFCKELINFQKMYNKHTIYKHVCENVQKCLPNPGAESQSQLLQNIGKCDGSSDEDDTPEDEDLSEDDFVGMSSIQFSVTLAIILLLIICFLFFIFFKFTPFGTWYSLQIKKKKRIFNSLYEQARKLLHNSSNESINLQNSEFNIPYNFTGDE
ncbi:PIR Superfamily Protein [Plasmodium ovale wallikeri]|uniref:PIR Superfamily Protein n=1 Tax=Plasmodium ovale wallikeri TaxID=864142 RepID=A0A1A9AG45_PLAOA|nr:PIR Superfamily Protein [Plasmodium ovale wallikeri]SBT55524.1 PIR Superfamily Protein [Plasmodium ovale wallikeri]